jgi:hypothetical protein
MAFIIDPRLNLENAIKYGVRAYRAKKRIHHQEECTEWDNLCDNYDMYKEEGAYNYARYNSGETKRWKCPVLNFSECEIHALRDDAWIRLDSDDLQTDEEYLQSYIDNIRASWMHGRMSYCNVCILGSDITSLININSTIPWLDSNESKAFKLWVYYNIRNTRVPENDVEMWVEVQRIYSSYMTDDVRRRSKMDAEATGEPSMLRDIWLG